MFTWILLGAKLHRIEFIEFKFQPQKKKNSITKLTPGYRIFVILG